jgi:hypothetical protein
MLVARDDQIGIACQGTGKHIIVVWIARNYPRHANRGSHDGQAPYISHDSKWSQPRLRKPLGKFFARCYVHQLCQ